MWRRMEVVRLAVAAAALAGCCSAAKPNIVYIMTDDQDVELGGMTPMPKTQHLLGDLVRLP